VAVSPSTLVVRPDSGRVELALLAESRRMGFIDAGAHRTFSQLVEACGGPAFAQRAPADPWLVRTLLATEAPRLARPVFGDVATTADFALQADQLRGELYSQDLTPSFLSDVALTGRTGDKVRALAALFTAVDDRLEALQLVDRRAVIRTSRTKLKTGRASRGRWGPAGCGEGFSGLRTGRPKAELPVLGAPWTDECLTDERGGPA
jgi:hypothetical protein